MKARQCSIGEKALARFLVRKEGREIPVDNGSVSWIEAAGDYVRLHTKGEDFMLRDSLACLEGQLSESFGRIHRSALVRFDQVAELRPTAHGDWDLVLQSGDVLWMSRTYRGPFRRDLQSPTAAR